jgi:hypothetical protein
MGWEGDREAGVVRWLHNFVQLIFGVGWWECVGSWVWDRVEVKIRRENLEGLSKVVRRDGLTCRGHPYVLYVHKGRKYIIIIYATQPRALSTAKSKPNLTPCVQTIKPMQIQVQPNPEL